MWKEIKGYPDYQIDQNGHVRSFKKAGRPSMLKPMVHKGINGSESVIVQLYNNDGSCNRSVARLVAEAFMPPPDAGEKLCHLNGNALDNRRVNLYWSGHDPREKKRAVRATHRITGVQEEYPSLWAAVQHIRRGMTRGLLYKAIEQPRLNGAKRYLRDRYWEWAE